MDNEQDFCAKCGAGVWQHGVASEEIAGKTYCMTCAGKVDRIALSVEAEAAVAEAAEAESLKTRSSICALCKASVPCVGFGTLHYGESFYHRKCFEEMEARWKTPEKRSLWSKVRGWFSGSEEKSVATVSAAVEPVTSPVRAPVVPQAPSTAAMVEPAREGPLVATGPAASKYAVTDNGCDDDFCAACGAEVWRHGQSCIRVGEKNYCDKCAPAA